MEKQPLTPFRPEQRPVKAVAAQEPAHSSTDHHWNVVPAVTFWAIASSFGMSMPKSSEMLVLLMVTVAQTHSNSLTRKLWASLPVE